MPPPNNSFDASGFSLDFIDNLAVPYRLPAASIPALDARSRWQLEREQKQLWRRLVAVWNDDAVACHIYVARLYTQRYPKDMYGWIVLADVLPAVASYDEAMLALHTARKLSPKNKLDFIYS